MAGEGMLKPVRMCKIRAIGLRKHLKNAVAAMHEYGKLEIGEIKAGELENYSELPEHQQLLQHGIKLEGMLNELKSGEYSENLLPAKQKPVLRRQEIEKLERELSSISKQVSVIENRLEELSADEGNLKFFRKFKLDFSLFNVPEVIVIAGLLGIENLARARLELAHSVKHYSVMQKEHSGRQQIVLVGIERSLAEKAIEALEKHGFKELALPQAKGIPSEAIKRIQKEQAMLRQKKAFLEKRIAALSRDYADRAAITLAVLEIEKDRAGVTKNFGKTEACFAFEAFLPEKDFAAAQKLLETRLGGKVFVEKISAEELEKQHVDAPVLLDNPKAIGQFEYMVSFMSLPKSFELDPTIVFTIMFPVFYGMMLGDVGYGIISLGIALWLKKKLAKSEIMENVARIWIAAAATTILFGILYDEFLGFTHHELLEKFGIDATLYHGLERLHEIEALLPLTIIVGVVSIASGFLLGFVNAVMEKDRKHAIAKLAWFFAVISGTVAVAGAMFNVFGQAETLIAGTVLLASIAAIIKMEGIVGAIELPSVAGNILSFARILAVGLASVVVAVIINQLLEPKLEQGLLFLVTLPVFLLLHAINAFIGMFEALIQGARLNFVEVFSKFFHGGGKQFVPFSVKNTIKRKNFGR